MDLMLFSGRFATTFDFPKKRNLQTLFFPFFSMHIFFLFSTTPIMTACCAGLLRANSVAVVYHALAGKTVALAGETVEFGNPY
jgi:hypothetical protein